MLLEAGPLIQHLVAEVGACSVGHLGIQTPGPTGLTVRDHGRVLGSCERIDRQVTSIVLGIVTWAVLGLVLHLVGPQVGCRLMVVEGVDEASIIHVRQGLPGRVEGVGWTRHDLLTHILGGRARRGDIPSASDLKFELEGHLFILGNKQFRRI